MTSTLTHLGAFMEHDPEDFCNPVGLGRFLLIFASLCAPAIGYCLAEIFQ